VISEITLDQFLHDLRICHSQRLPASYVWVLGSGAAATSEVPTGSTLAMRWLRELFDVRRSKDKATDLASWNAAEELGLPDLDPATPAAFYGALYHKRFGYRPKLGQEFLRSQILGRTPSYGYAALAQIQTESAHKYAVTTNFDHLLEEAHRRYLNRELIVCASDDQAATVQRLPDQPLLAKVHGDIFTRPRMTRITLRSLGRSGSTLFGRSSVAIFLFSSDTGATTPGS
jgi:hypothetical protein